MRVLVLLALLGAGCNDGGLGEDPDGGATPDLMSPLPPESCNGRDDDGDGRIDEGCPIRITTDEADDTQPALDGNRLAWTRRRPDMPSELWVKDLPAGAERMIATDVGLIALSGNHVAWTEKSVKIFVVDLTTLAKTEVTRNPSN